MKAERREARAAERRAPAERRTETLYVHGTTGLAHFFYWHGGYMTPMYLSRPPAMCVNNNHVAQIGATCWYTAAWNALILSPAIRKMIVDRWNKLSASDRHQIEGIHPDHVCQLNMTPKYSVRFIMSQIALLNEPLQPSFLTMAARQTKAVSADPSSGDTGLTHTGILQILHHVFGPQASAIGFGRDNNFTLRDASKSDTRIVVLRGCHTWNGVIPSVYLERCEERNGGNGQNTRLYLAAACFGWWFQSKDSTPRPQGRHVVAGYICDGKYYIYDSRMSEPIACNWVHGDFDYYTDIVRRHGYELIDPNDGWPVCQYAIYTWMKEETPNRFEFAPVREAPSSARRALRSRHFSGAQHPRYGEYRRRPFLPYLLGKPMRPNL